MARRAERDALAVQVTWTVEGMEGGQKAVWGAEGELKCVVQQQGRRAGGVK
jgi:hypothetical protein